VSYMIAMPTGKTALPLRPMICPPETWKMPVCWPGVGVGVGLVEGVGVGVRPGVGFGVGLAVGEPEGVGLA
jgi:hypothetical protein